MPASAGPALSGERLVAVYRLAGDEAEARARARDLCLEQTVEIPGDLVPDAIEAEIVGRVEALRSTGERSCEVRISFAVECVGAELTQLLNLLFGNISLKPGIRLERFELPPSLRAGFKGPRFGRAGLRALTGVEARPLLCSALKPMGLDPAALAELAYQLALGGIDLIKDDHGLADQPFCPFGERVARCAEAVRRANQETGRTCLYLANVSAPAALLRERARRARHAGAGGLVLAPGLVSFDATRQLADDDALALPILSHPALLGSLTLHPGDGISHGALYGQLMRLAGADAVIFPSYGGRFAFTQDQCRDLVDGSACDMGGIAPSLPVPAGGMTLDRVDELVAFYGPDAVLLIGGDLLRQAPNISAACERFVARVERATATLG